MSPNPEEIAHLVRTVVGRTLGKDAAERKIGTHGKVGPIKNLGQRMIISEQAVRQMPNGSKQTIPANSIVTPLAQQAAQEKRIEFVQVAPEDAAGAVGQVQSHIRDSSAPYRTQESENRVVAIGADHGGFELKEMIECWLSDSGYSVIDCGTHSKESVDYPDYAFAVAQQVAGGRAFRGVIVDGAGIGSCMAANKVPGIRASMCYDQATAVNSREHNNANVLTLGAGLIGPALAKQIVLTWLKTDFGGGRHARRVDKIDAIGRRFSK